LYIFYFLVNYFLYIFAKHITYKHIIMSEQKFKSLVSFNKSIHKIGVEKSIKLYGNKRSFNKYLEKLIIKDN
jgi:hypothetical protein